MQNIIDALLERGYEYQEWSDSYIKGRTRVYFKGNSMYVIFSDDRGNVVVWSDIDIIDLQQGTNKVLGLLEALEQ